MHTLDAFSDTLPEEFVGKYDVVHIAIFATIVKDNNPEPLLKNLLRMLSKYARRDSTLAINHFGNEWFERDSFGRASRKRDLCTLLICYLYD